MKFDKHSTQFRCYTWQGFTQSAKKCGKDRSFLGGQVWFFQNGYRAVGFSLPHDKTLFGVWFGVGEIIWKRK